MTSTDRFADAQERDINLVAIVRVLWRYKFLIAAVALIVALAAVYVALTATEIFRAEVIVSDAHENNQNGSRLLSGSLGGLASLAGLSGIGTSNSSQEAQAVLKSYRLPSEFISRYRLAGLLTAGSGRNPSVWYATKRFRETVLSVSQDKVTGITTVGIEWKDPVVAARWANDLVTLANELIRARAVTDATRNVEYLRKQIETTNVLEMQQVMYDLIENETKTLMLANGRMEYAFTVVDPAVAPELRVRPRRTLLVLTGFALGVILGSGLALALNTWRIWREQTGGARA